MNKRLVVVGAATMLVLSTFDSRTPCVLLESDCRPDWRGDSPSRPGAVDIGAHGRWTPAAGTAMPSGSVVVGRT